MAGPREEVEHGPAVEDQTLCGEQSGVACEGARVAADEDEDLGLGPHERCHGSSTEAIACGIGDHDRCRRGPPTLDVGPDDSGVTPSEVDTGVSNGVPSSFNSDHRPRATHRHRKQPDPSVRIDKASIGCLRSQRPDFVDERVASGRAVLEKRVGADPEPLSVDFLVDPGPLAGGELVLGDDDHVLGNDSITHAVIDDDESLAGAVANPDADLPRPGKPAVDKDLFCERVDGTAGIRHDQVVRTTHPVSRSTVVHAGANRGATVIVFQRAHRRVRGVDVRPAQLIDHHRRLHGQLGVRRDMKKVATTATLELVRTRYGDSIGRGLADRDHPSARPTLVGAHDLGRYQLARQRPFDEHDTAVFSSGDSGTVPRRGSYAQLHAGNGIHAPREAALRLGSTSVSTMNHRPIEISPSVLPADFARLGEELIELEKAGCDRIHWDVMDGVFVPNLTIGPDIVRSCRSHVALPFEAHLMVVNVDEMAPLYVDAGCEVVMIHVEACTHLHRSLDTVRQLGARAGVVLNPHTPASTIQHVLEVTDHVLIMTVNPGFGGQRYIPLVSKISEVKAMIDAGNHDIDIEIDGGINAETIKECATAGANVFVSGSALFRYEDRAAGVAELKANAEAARA